ncbi:MAG: DUF4388 domain-containing protein [Pseudomonadota bacterium]
MALNGHIRTVSLAGILQLLCRENKSGILRVTLRGQNEEYQIYYLDGAIIYAIQSKKEARLGTLLIRDGLATSAQMDKCLAIARVKKQAVGRILVEEGVIPIEILERYIYKQVEEIIYNLFLWDDGEFSYNDTHINLSWMVVVKLNTLQLVVDASRRLDECRQGVKENPA